MTDYLASSANEFSISFTVIAELIIVPSLSKTIILGIELTLYFLTIGELYFLKSQI